MAMLSNVLGDELVHERRAGRKAGTLRAGAAWYVVARLSELAAASYGRTRIVPVMPMKSCSAQ
jgi:hypothetical protein